MISDELLAAALKKNKALDEAALKNLLSEGKSSGRSLEDLIYDRNLIDEKLVAQAKSEILQVPVKLFQPNEEIDIKILTLVPEDAARQYKILAFGRDSQNLYIGMVHPEDTKAQEAVKFILSRQKNLNFKIYLITNSDLVRYLKNYQNLPDQLAKILQEFQQKYPKKLKTSASTTQLVDLEDSGGAIVEEAPIIKLLSTILTYAVRARASDVHVEPQRSRLRVRLRIDGILFSSIILPLEIYAPLISRVKILANLKIDETRIPQDGRFRTLVDGKQIDYRVSTLPAAFGEKVAIRVLDPSIGLKNIEELGLAGRNLDVLRLGLEKPFGMILISGPTGSGKSTTLYAILQKLNKDGVNIISLEDPVEYTMEGVNQSQVLPEIGYTFARALRQIVRQDPDIILVGEIRDSETAGLAIHAALTGHIVLSTIHTNNAIGVVPRLIDMGVEPFLLPPALNLMVSQRLVRRLCPKCKKAIQAPVEFEPIIEEALKDLSETVRAKLNYKKPYTIYQAVGCSECKNKGFIGRVGMFEILTMSHNMEKIVMDRLPESELVEEAKKQGMINLRQDGIIKVLEGITSIEEVLKET